MVYGEEGMPCEIADGGGSPTRGNIIRGTVKKRERETEKKKNISIPGAVVLGQWVAASSAIASVEANIPWVDLGTLP